MKRIYILTLVIFLLSFVFAPVRGETESYTDMTIDQAVTFALEQNKDIKDAYEETIRANFQIMEAASGAFPQINGQWTFGKNLKPQIFVISFPDEDGVMRKSRLKVGTDHSMNLGANLTQSLYVGGKIGTALKAAKIYKNMSGENFKAVKQSVIMGVSNAFNGILLTEEMIMIAGESLAQAQMHLKNVETLHRNGRATDYDLLRARVHVANIKPQVLEAKNSERIALLKFKYIIGIPPETVLTIKGELSEPDTSLFVLADAETAFENRPDLKVSEFGVDLQEKAIRIAKGDFLPTLTAGTTFAYEGNFDVLKYDARDWNPFWFANVSLTFPIFTGLKNYAKYKQAKVDFRKAQTAYRK